MAAAISAGGGAASATACGSPAGAFSPDIGETASALTSAAAAETERGTSWTSSTGGAASRVSRGTAERTGSETGGSGTGSATGSIAGAPIAAVRDSCAASTEADGAGSVPDRASADASAPPPGRSTIFIRRSAVRSVFALGGVPGTTAGAGGGFCLTINDFGAWVFPVRMACAVDGSRTESTFFTSTPMP